MAAPGVVVTTSTRSGPLGTPRAASGQYFVIGLAERGPTDVATKINSLGDYRRLFGERVTYGALYDDLAMFFETGGTQAWVVRAVGAAATKGTLTLSDGAGSPVPTIRIDAANEGAWSSRIKVQVEVGGAGANSRKITIRLDDNVVEVQNNLTSVAGIVTAFARSPYVRATDLGSASAAPLNLPAVNAAGGVVLSAGTDDRAAVNAARLTALLPLFKIGLGDGSVSAPGYGAAMHTALQAHAADNRRVAILTGARGDSVTTLSTTGLGLASNGQHAGLFAPWVQVGDGAGGTRTISPEGYVAGSRAKAHETAGPWQPGAGELSINSYIIGLDQEFTRADAETLDASRVSPIRTVQGRARIYGWRSLSGNEVDYASLTVQDLLNRLVTEAEMRLEQFVFRTVDGRGQLFSQMAGVLVGFLEPIKAAGGIFERIDPLTGDLLDQGYSVNVGPNLNTAETLARNEVRAEIAVRPSPNASLITLSIVKAGLTAAV